MNSYIYTTRTHTPSRVLRPGSLAIAFVVAVAIVLALRFAVNHGTALPSASVGANGPAVAQESPRPLLPGVVGTPLGDSDTVPAGSGEAPATIR